MKKLLLSLTLLLAVCLNANALQYQFNLGDINGANLSANLLGLQVTGGVNYTKINVLSTMPSIEIGGEASVIMPSVGVAFNLYSQDNTKVFIGAEYQVMIPTVKVINRNANDPNAAQNELNTNVMIQQALDRLSSSGINIYIKPVYMMSKDFGLNATFGVRLATSTIDSFGKSNLTYDTTYTQLGFTYNL